MIKLKDSVVKRGGVSTAYWYGKTDDITAVLEPGEVRFNFVPPSKGGGETQVMLRLGNQDLKDILRALAIQNLELATTFAECTKLAINSLNKVKR